MESPVKLDFWICRLLFQGPRHFEFLSPEVAQWKYDSESQQQNALGKNTLNLRRRLTTSILNQIARLVDDSESDWPHDDQQPRFWIRPPMSVGPTMIKNHDSESELPLLLNWTPRNWFWMDGWPEPSQIHDSESKPQRLLAEHQFKWRWFWIETWPKPKLPSQGKANHVSQLVTCYFDSESECRIFRGNPLQQIIKSQFRGDSERQVAKLEKEGKILTRIASKSPWSRHGIATETWFLDLLAAASGPKIFWISRSRSCTMEIRFRITTAKRLGKNTFNLRRRLTTSILNQIARLVDDSESEWPHDDQQPRFWIRPPMSVGPTMIRNHDSESELPLLMNWTPRNWFWMDGWPEPSQIHDSESKPQRLLAEHQFKWRFWIETWPMPKLPSQGKANHVSQLVTCYFDSESECRIFRGNPLQQIIKSQLWGDSERQVAKLEKEGKILTRIASKSPWSRHGIATETWFLDLLAAASGPKIFWISRSRSCTMEIRFRITTAKRLGKKKKKHLISGGGSPLRFWIKLPGWLTILNQSGPMMINNHDSESDRQCQLVPRWSRTTIPNRNCHC